MIPVIVKPAVLTFAEYQAIHQEQQRQRYPSQAVPRPVTSDSWRKKGQLWLGSVISMGASYWWLGLGSWFAGAVIVTLFTGISLAHEWVEYRRAFRQHTKTQPATGFVLNADTVIIQRENHRRTLGWRDFYSIQRVSDWVLLYTSVEHCYYLNLTQVQAPATANDVLALLPQRLIPAE